MLGSAYLLDPAIEVVMCSDEQIYLPLLNPNTALITATVSDPLGDSGVDLRYRDRTEERWTSLEMTAILDRLLGANSGKRQRN